MCSGFEGGGLREHLRQLLQRAVVSLVFADPLLQEGLEPGVELDRHVEQRVATGLIGADRDQIAALSTGQIAGLSTNQIAALGSRQIATLGVDDIAALTEYLSASSPVAPPATDRVTELP